MDHLYVHIAFCRSRCAYCDFASEPVAAHAAAGRVQAYVRALRAELAARLDAGPPVLRTVYVGGGTPTVLPAGGLVALARDLAALCSSGGSDGDRAEFTVEANPGTIDAPLLQQLADAGVTRLSLGVQSFSPALRAALGRQVTQEEIAAALGAVAGVGWSDWNLDLVFGIPGQDWGTAAADLDAAVAAGPTHISLYDLTYTPAFSARVAATLGAGARRAAGAFAEEHYARAVAHLEAAGYRRYEVSNFALPGHECRHNQAYWRGEDYLGIGASAVSTVSVDGTAARGAAAAPAAAPLTPAPLTAAPLTRAAEPAAPSLASPAATLPPAERRSNPRSVAAYLASEPPAVEWLSPGVRLWERAMLGLRTSEGVDEAAVLPVVDAAARDRLLGQGCLERLHGRIRVNPGHLDVSNAVIGMLLVDPSLLAGPEGSRSLDAGRR